MLQRVMKAFAIHLLFLLVALGLIYAAVGGQDSLSPTMRMQYEGQPADVLLQLVADARGRIMSWAVIVFTVSWLAASIFLSSAQRTHPANERQAASRKGLWSGMILLAIVVAAILVWLRLVNVGVSTELASDSYLLATLGGGLLMVLAHYLATALVVKAAMRPSVPMATALPDVWSR